MREDSRGLGCTIFVNNCSQHIHRIYYMMHFLDFKELITLLQPTSPKTFSWSSNFFFLVAGGLGVGVFCDDSFI